MNKRSTKVFKPALEAPRERLYKLMRTDECWAPSYGEGKAYPVHLIDHEEYPDLEPGFYQSDDRGEPVGEPVEAYLEVGIVPLMNLVDNEPIHFTYRVCVWGGDDRGMEKDLDTYEEAYKLYESLKEPLNTDSLKIEGFIPA